MGDFVNFSGISWSIDWFNIGWVPVRQVR